MKKLLTTSAIVLFFFVFGFSQEILIRDEVEHLMEVYPSEADRFQEALEKGETIAFQNSTIYAIKEDGTQEIIITDLCCW